jgi:hypothetical protein
VSKIRIESTILWLRTHLITSSTLVSIIYFIILMKSISKALPSNSSLDCIESFSGYNIFNSFLFIPGKNMNTIYLRESTVLVANSADRVPSVVRILWSMYSPVASFQGNIPYSTIVNQQLRTTFRLRSFTMAEG